MKIGISNNHYPEQRNILVNPENDYINLKKRNVFYFLNPLRTRLLKKINVSSSYLSLLQWGRSPTFSICSMKWQ
ncbi:hypothetical protein WDV93_13200 [Pantoea ananatis]